MAQLSLTSPDLAIGAERAVDIYGVAPRRLAAGAIGVVALLFVLLLALASPQPEALGAPADQPAGRAAPTAGAPGS